MNPNFSNPQWEKRTSDELYTEYESILHQHRVSLRPTLIQLFDSETHWGKWDPIMRTISIAKKLIQNHSWFHVQGILKHEMAHQMVDECPFFNKESRPHGESFLLACKRLGVPNAFTHSSVQLQESPLDWKTEKKNEASEKLLDKVQKLLALATSSNEHEALLAMNKVREIYARYNLENEQKNEKSNFVHLIVNHHKKRIEAHQNRITSILVEHFFVKILFSQLFDAKSGEYHRVFEITGTRENTLMAEYVYYFLLQQSNFWVKETIQAGQRKISPLERKSFRLGILQGFSDKLRQSEQVITTPSKGTELTVIGKAVQKFRHNQELDSYLSEVYPNIKNVSHSNHYLDEFAFVAGKKIGRTICLHQAITTESKNYGRLLD